MKILRYIKTLLIAGPVVLFNHIFYICRYAKHPEKYPFEKRYNKVRKEIRFVFKLLHVDLSGVKLEEYANAKEKCLIVTNHYSAADPLLLIAASEKPLTFVCKKEVLKFPFVGKITKVIECFYLDRKNVMNQLTEIRNIVSYLKDESKPSVIIFIEGTRSKDPSKPCLEFHPGTLKIAQMASVPLYCGALYGSFRVLSKKNYLRRFPVFFNFYKTMSSEEVKSFNTTELADKLQKETDIYVSSLRKLDLDYINKLSGCKKRKDLESRVDISVNS